MKRKRKTKKDYRKEFEGGDKLFEYCWRRAIKHSYGEEDIQGLIEYFASVAINDEKSKFYING